MEALKVGVPITICIRRLDNDTNSISCRLVILENLVHLEARCLTHKKIRGGSP
jgi:hypothetical protein